MAFPTTGILDSGTRPDESPATGWTDGPDGLTFGGIKVSSNQLVPISGDAWSYWNAGEVGPDCEGYLTEPVLGSNMTVYARLNPIGTRSLDGYGVLRNSSTTYSIRRRDNDVDTQLGATVTIGTALTAGASFGISCVGSTISAYNKPSGGSWTFLDSRSDASYSGAGYLAVFFSSASGRMVDFGGGTVVTTVTGATAAAFSITPATAGIREVLGESAAALLITPSTAGVRATAGASAAAFSVVPATDGFHAGVGASAASVPIAITTAGTRQAFGASSASVPFDFSTSAGAAVISGASAMTFSVTASTAGLRVVVGVTATVVVVTPTTAGTLQRVGASAAVFTVGFTTTATLGQFGASATLISIVPATAGEGVAPPAPLVPYAFAPPESRRALAVIRTRTAEKGWTVLGSEIASGMVPEGIQLSADRSGPTTAGFRLRRDPTLPQPDLSAFAETEVEIGGTVVWGGRVWDTPGQQADDRSLSVTANGWRGHLDDDVYQRLYVMQDMTRFVDARSLPTTPLSYFHSQPSVKTGGQIWLNWPPGYTVAASEFVTATFDAGASLINRGVVTFTRVGPDDAGDTFYIRLSSNPDPTAGGDDTSVVLTSTGATLSRTATTPRRYCHLILYHSGGAGTFGGTDQGVQITSCLLAGSTSWESGGSSALRPHQVVLDARSQAAPLLSSSTERVNQTSSFFIPQLLTDGYQSPWEMMSAANAYLGWNLGVDARKRLIFEPRPTAPTYLVGIDAAGVQFSDQSVISAETVYNRVVVQGQDAGGVTLYVIRTAASPLLDRLGVTRTKVLQVSAVLNTTSAAAIGDVWLAENSRAQFRGSLSVVGMGGIMDAVSGRAVHPSEVLLSTGKLIRIADIHDPETGGEGRDGVIDSVSYDHDSETVNISIDNTRGRFASLLERIGALQSLVTAA